MEDYNHQAWRNDSLLLGGFDEDELTEDQKDIILQPSEAPENYACDGEVTARDALVQWIHNMKGSGLTMLQIYRARKMNNI